MKFLKSWTFANVRTMLELAGFIATIVMAVVAVLAFGKLDVVLRDRTFINVSEAARHVVRHPDQAQVLFTTAARDLKAGSLTKEDGEQLGRLLEGFKSLQGRPEVCRRWDAMPPSVKKQEGLARLVDQAIHLEECHLS